MEGDLCAYGSSGSCCQSILTGSCGPALPFPPELSCHSADRLGHRSPEGNGHFQAVRAVVLVVAVQGGR